MPKRLQQASVESALRYLGTRDRGEIIEFLTHALRRPNGTSGSALTPITERTAMLDDWTIEERAAALWELIKEGIIDPDVGPTRLSRRRRALQAAFRLPDEDIEKSWGSSLTERFKQLKPLEAVFGQPTSTQPMEMAWKHGVQLLATYLKQRFAELQSPDDWERYRRVESIGASGQPTARSSSDAGADIDVFRKPSRGAQPLFVELFITTVFMHGRSVYRRITERLITAREDDVEYYTARGFTTSSDTPKLTHVPVHALWGCSAEAVTPSRSGEPSTTRLRFQKPLRNGQQAHFASEAVFQESLIENRDWINVHVDHYGIARGQLMYGDQLPTRGLTIRIRFDEAELPAAVWWYAELTESERYVPPRLGDKQRLDISGLDVQHTFVEHACQPRESYGIAFSWSAEHLD